MALSNEGKKILLAELERLKGEKNILLSKKSALTNEYDTLGTKKDALVAALTAVQTAITNIQQDLHG